MKLLAIENNDKMENLEDFKLPKDLVGRCLLIVEETHKKIGSRNLPGLMATKRNALVSTAIPECWVFFSSVGASARIRTSLAIIAIISLIASPFINWWIMSISVISLLGVIYFNLEERSLLITLAAALLGAEMLITDFAGWGSAYPGIRETMVRVFKNKSIMPFKPELLDFYLPRRNELDAEMLQAFGPQKD